MEKVKILGVSVDNLTLEEALKRIEGMVESGKSNLVVTANPEIIMVAGENQTFANHLEKASMITADGIGLVIGARILGKPLRQRVTGIDLVTALLKEVSGGKRNYRFYFVGAKPGVAQKAAQRILQTYPGVEIAGIHHGYFKDDSEIIKDIIEKKPDILLAAMGMGKQEAWITERVFTAGVPVSIGVGGSFDVFAGEAKRAPRWMQRAGVEWLYRLIKQPSRFGRMLKLPQFLLAVIASRITDKS